MEGSLQAEQVQFPGLTHLFICLREMGLGRGCGILGCGNKFSIYAAAGICCHKKDLSLICGVLAHNCGT